MLEPTPPASQPPARPPTLDVGSRALIDPYENSEESLGSSPPHSSHPTAPRRSQTSPSLLGLSPSGSNGGVSSGSPSSYNSSGMYTSATGATSNNNNGSTPSSLVGAPATYVDQRKAVAAHFAIHIFNLNGTAIANFKSEPSSFSISQSWGWKSKTLFNTEYLGQVALDNLGFPSSSSSSTSTSAADDDISPQARTPPNLGGTAAHHHNRRHHTDAGGPRLDSLKATVTMGLI